MGGIEVNYSDYWASLQGKPESKEGKEARFTTKARRHEEGSGEAKKLENIFQYETHCRNLTKISNIFLLLFPSCFFVSSCLCGESTLFFLVLSRLMDGASLGHPSSPFDGRYRPAEWMEKSSSPGGGTIHL
jgi:hypothetical protein